ncbi:hypothetical protein TcWFU_009638 [Taenia crassiceps]|uniref:Uncharacterized protein n=1 Tax=Taenia crassiceps TaxID=6207 RepID=A0ABR4QK85_9CEST
MPSNFGKAFQCSSLTRCWCSNPSTQGEAMGTCCQPLERNPIQPFECLGFPKTTSKSHISTSTMAYLCKLNTPLRKTQHLNADGNCVRAERSIVELGDLNALNNCTTSCPMIAEHCTYKQQPQHRDYTVNADECRSLRDVCSAMAHSRKVKETPTNRQLNTSMALSKLCSQAPFMRLASSQTRQRSLAYKTCAHRACTHLRRTVIFGCIPFDFTMPVGCFPSFRRKIKKFNKGKAPLSKKEEAKNDVSHKTLKPTEINNHAKGKADTSTKIEQQAEVAQQRQEEETKAQNVNKKTFEQVAEVHQSAKSAANELVTSPNATEHIREVNESHGCETASSETIMMEHEEARETATTQEADSPCDIFPAKATVELQCEGVPSTERMAEFGENQKPTAPQETEPPRNALPAEVTVKHEKEFQSGSASPMEEATGFATDHGYDISKEVETFTEGIVGHGEELQCESISPTEEMVEFVVNQESTVSQEAGPPHDTSPTEDTMAHGEELQCESVPPTEEMVEFVVNQESTVSQEAGPPHDTSPTEDTMAHGEELQCESVPPTEEMVEFVVNQESTVSQEAGPPHDTSPTEDTMAHGEELQCESVPPTEEMVEFVVNQESTVSQEAGPPHDTSPTEDTMAHGEELQCESVPPTEEMVEFVVNQESTVSQEAGPPHDTSPTEDTMAHGEELQCESVPPTEEMVEFVVNQESTVSQEAGPPHDTSPTEDTMAHGEELQCESVPPTEEMVEFVVNQESTVSQEAELPRETVPTMTEYFEVQGFIGLPEKGFAQESVHNMGEKSAQVNESGHPTNIEEEHKNVQNSSELQASVLPEGFHWETVSVQLPEGAIDIHELHLPMHVGLVETEKGEIPCKYLKTKGSFYAGIDGREEDFVNGKILCLDPKMGGSIEIEWIHVSTPDIRSRNLVAGARDANGKLLYIARGMIPLTGPYPYYELSSGWVSEDLEYAHLPYGGVEWEQRDFDVLAWKPKCF